MAFHCLRDLNYNMQIKVKLCGFTTKETVDLAVKRGASFIGFVFHEKSPRNILPQKAKEISVDIPKTVKKVAVVVEPSDDELKQIISNLNPDFLQIHSNDYLRILQIKNNFKIPIIKAFQISNISDLGSIKEYEEIAEYFLFDAKNSGSGMSFDWRILKNLRTTKKWFLSGGINIDNIANALNETNAKIVDLSSGIEEIRGIKSAKLITDFMSKISTINKSYE